MLEYNNWSMSLNSELYFKKIIWILYTVSLIIKCLNRVNVFSHMQGLTVLPTIYLYKTLLNAVTVLQKETIIWKEGYRKANKKIRMGIPRLILKGKK